MLIGSETDTNMGVFFVHDLSHFFLKFKKKTMSIHELILLGQITCIMVIIKVRETNDCFLLTNNFMMFTNLSQGILTMLL